jgi:hypothetical protein
MPRKSYLEIQIIFANEKCKLLTTEEEINQMMEKQKKHLKLRYIASCGHENKVFLCNFTGKKSGIKCPSCKREELANLKRGEEKLSPLASNIAIVESEGFKRCKELLSERFYVQRTNNGCLADFVVKPREVTQDKWLLCQLKTSTKPSGGVYSFAWMNKNYSDCLIVCTCLSDNKFWVFDYQEVKGVTKVSIGLRKSCYNKNLILPSNLASIFSTFYNNKPLSPKSDALVPLTKYCKIEHEYRLRRENCLSFIKFSYGEVDNAVYDFIINGKKHQEKVASNKQQNHNVFRAQLVKSGRKNTRQGNVSYAKGDNDFYWVWLKATPFFLVFPECVLVERGYVGGGTKQSSIGFNFDVFDWKRDYLFNLNCLDRVSFLKHIKALEVTTDEVKIPPLVIHVSEVVPCRERKRYYCTDCNAEICSTAKRCVKCKGIYSRKRYYCTDCNAEICSTAKRCVKCQEIYSRKVERPSKETLERLLKESNYVQVGRMFGVSDNAIRKWLKYYQRNEV